MEDLEIGPGPEVLPCEARHVAARFLITGEDGAEPPIIRSIPVPPGLMRATRKRLLEFRVGRCCARAALVALGVGPYVPDLDQSGLPVWPSGVVGSITHTGGCARAAVASLSDARAIGVDSEQIVPPHRARLVAAAIAKESEIAAGCDVGLDRCQALTLAFSAKEAVFKCLHRLVGRRFDFSDARLEHVDGHSRTFTIRIASPLSADYPIGTALTGRFAIEGAILHTGMLLRTDARIDHQRI